MNKLETLKRTILEHQMYYLEELKVSKDFIDIVKLATEKFTKEKDIEALEKLSENVEGIIYYFKLLKGDIKAEKVKESFKKVLEK